MSRKRLLFLLIGLAIGIVLILLWLNFIDIDDLLVRMRSIDRNLVIWASLAYLSAYFIRSWRWNLLLKKQASLSLYRTWLYSMGGNWVNYLIPIRLGEVVKAWFVKRNHGVPMLNVFPSIFIDKTFDTLGIFFVLIMIPLLGVRPSSGMTVLLSLLGLVFLVSLAILFLSVWRKDTVVQLLQALFSWLPNKAKEKIHRYIEIFIQGLNVFEHHWSRLAYAVLLTALGVGLDGLYFWLVFRAFGIDYPFVKVLFGYTLINLSYALPQPPAQLGSNEWMMIIIFSIGFALTRQDASAIMAFAHLLTAILIGVIGLIAIGLSGSQILRAIFHGEKIYEQ
ncbi:MAG: flippase-like domain-containing protein [Candidatus Syntrophosphaera sp.]|nr:flippase-like domain-containing protein [Candidatus Syntrophosphaera sp.]